MESFDREIAEACAERAPKRGPARVLVVVGDDGACPPPLIDIMKRRRHRCTRVGGLEEACLAVARRPFDVVILDRKLPDGDGLKLVSLLQRTSPATKTMVITRGGDVPAAVEAIRSGAVDYITLPVEPADFIDRVESAVLKSRADRQRDERLTRLRKICKELNNARQEISEQVDLLCNDLVASYRDISDQMNEVAMTSEFRTLLRQELDVEDLLRTALEYLLTKTGPTNAAVFLPDSGGQYSLGAYVNYDCPRDSVSALLEHLQGSICPQIGSESDLVIFNDAREFAEWIGMESGFLAKSQIVAYACRHEGECLAVFVLFRSKADPFADHLAGTLDVLRSIFAEQLAHVIRVHHRAMPEWPAEPPDDEYDVPDDCDYGFGFEGDLAA